MEIRRVGREELPEGHTWAIVERAGSVTVLAIDSFAERVACAVYSSSNRAANLPSASASRCNSAR